MKGIGARERGSRGAWELGSGDEDVAWEKGSEGSKGFAVANPGLAEVGRVCSEKVKAEAR